MTDPEEKTDPWIEAALRTHLGPPPNEVEEAERFLIEQDDPTGAKREDAQLSHDIQVHGQMSDVDRFPFLWRFGKQPLSRYDMVVKDIVLKEEMDSNKFVLEISNCSGVSEASIVAAQNDIDY